MRTILEASQELLEQHKKGSALFTETNKEAVAAQSDKLIPLTIAFGDQMLKIDDLTNELRQLKHKQGGIR